MVNSKRFLTPKKRGGAKGSHKRMRGGMQSTIANFSATQLEMIQFLINADLNHSGTISKSEFDITLEFRKNLNVEEEKKFWDAFGLSDNKTYDGFLQFLREKKSEKIVKDGKVGNPS